MAEEWQALQAMKQARKKTELGPSSEKQWLVALLALIGVLSGAVAFFAALLLRDTIHDPLMGAMKHTRWYWKMGASLLLLVVVAGGITAGLALWRNSVKRQEAKVDEEQKIREAQYKMCNDMLLSVQKETDFNVMMGYMKPSTLCHNKKAIKSLVLSAAKRRKRCNKALARVEAATEVKGKEKILKKNLSCYNKSVMETHIADVKAERARCDSLLLTIRTDTRPSKEKQTLVDDTCYNAKKMRQVAA